MVPSSELGTGQRIAGWDVSSFGGRELGAVTGLHQSPYFGTSEAYWDPS